MSAAVPAPPFPGIAPSREPDDPFGLVGSVVAGKFRPDAVVAKGGFGVLYKGLHTTLDRPVALKVLRASHGDPRVQEAIQASFEQEARMIAQLSHPAIVQVIEFGVEVTAQGASLMWMALEWLDGRPLNYLLRERQGRRYSPAETLHLMRPVLEALAYAHDKGVAHRDLKPANVMVLQGRRGPTLKLIDFGIAKSMDEGESAGSGETKTQSVLAAYSPRYGAPEQLGHARTGPWTDVHAMALIITELLIGHPAYTSQANDHTELFGEILNPQRPTPGRFGISVGSWEEVLRKALAVRSAERYADAGVFLEELENALGPGGPDEGLDATTGIRRGSTSVPVMTGGMPNVVSVQRPSPKGRWIVGTVAGVLVLGVCVTAWVATRGPARAPVAAVPPHAPSSVPHSPESIAPEPIAPTRAAPAPPVAPMAPADMNIAVAPEPGPVGPAPGAVAVPSDGVPAESNGRVRHVPRGHAGAHAASVGSAPHVPAGGGGDPTID